MKIVNFVQLSTTPTQAQNMVELEYEKDIWDIRNLGIELPAAKYEYKVNFTTIFPVWLRQAAKLYIRYSLATLTYGGSLKRLEGIKRFSSFLSKSCLELKSSQINRLVIVNFLSYLISSKLSVKSRSDTLSSLKLFLELCCRNQWTDVPTENLIYKEDFPGQLRTQPRYIPQEVIEQLNRHRNELPEPIMRMVLVIKECGMRVAELCLLSCNCLLQDSQGDWFIRYYQNKMKKEITVPISRELVAVIQEQQQFIRENLGLDYPFLFCARKQGCRGRKFIPVSKPMFQECFANALNQLAKENNIHDSFGKLWHFQAHQFRHTVGTAMINSGVPQHIVQRYLGHESPQMTSVYAHIHDSTLKKEIAKFYGNVVNITGQVVEHENPELDKTDLQWFKRNVLAQTLPNGSCALPAPMKECPHANACLTCTHFRTTTEFLDQHKEQLEQTEKIIEKAKANGWNRQVEMNERVVTNLQNMINSLEASNGD